MSRICCSCGLNLADSLFYVDRVRGGRLRECRACKRQRAYFFTDLATIPVPRILGRCLLAECSKPDQFEGLCFFHHDHYRTQRHDQCGTGCGRQMRTIMEFDRGVCLVCSARFAVSAATGISLGITGASFAA